MSSLEETLGFKKLSSLSTVDRIESFASVSDTCTAKESEIEMESYWLDGRDYDSSNTYK